METGGIDHTFYEFTLICTWMYFLEEFHTLMFDFQNPFQFQLS